MKKIVSLTLCLALLFCLCSFSGCVGSADFAEGDAVVLSKVSKAEAAQTLYGTYNGKTVTVRSPRFTGIPVASVYSYKEAYCFMNGTVLFNAALADGAHLFQVNKDGKVLDRDYELSGDRIPADIVALNSITCPVPGGNVRGENAVVVQTGEPGAYSQHLCNLQGEKLSGEYDSIGYFYNGIALVTKDGKVGLIDDAGGVVLEPCIAYDSVSYPPKEKMYSPVFMHEDAFVLPIGGEFAIFTVLR